MRKPAFLITALLIALTLHAENHKIDSLRNALIKLSPTADTSRVRILNQLSKEWSSVNPDTAMAYANYAYTLSSKKDYKTGIAESRDNQGWININMGNFAQGYEYYTEALQLFEELHNEKGKAIVYNGLGVTYGMQEKYPEALQYFLKALSIYEKNNLVEGMASCYLKIGTAYQKIHEYAKALASFNKTLQLAEKSGDKKNAAHAYSNIAAIYGVTKQYDKCLEAISKSKQLAEEANSISALAAAYLNMGMAYSETNQLDKADTCLQKALTFFLQLKNAEQISRTYNGLANLAYARKDYAKSKDYVSQSNEIAADLNNTAIRYDNFELLVSISKDESDFEAATHYYEKMLSLKDSLFDAEKNNSIEVLKASHELEKKQITIEELKRDNKNKTAQRNSLLVAIGISIFLMLLLSYSVVSISRKNKIITERKKELTELNVLKDKFFSILSHDLRSPVSNILSSLNLFSSNVTLSENEKKVVFEQLKSATTSTLETMDNLLAWGQYQLHNTKNVPVKIDVQELTERVCRFLHQSAANKSITIVNKVEDHFTVTADMHQLEFILRNLLSNALKFSNTNSKVEVGARRIDDSINIYVRDYGTGMSKEVQDKLFEINSRKSKKGTVGEIGSGLGLVLSKEFIAQNHGTLTVKSEEGSGTTFAIKLSAVKEKV